MISHRIRSASILLLVLLTVGCGAPAPRSGDHAGGSSGSSGEVSFMVFGDPAELKAYQDLVAAFEASHPGSKVKLIHIPSQSDYRMRLGTDFAAGTPADVVLINYRRFAGFAAKGVVEPLAPYLEKSTVLNEADFYPEALNAFRWNGTLIGVPQNLSSLVVYYNKSLFAAAGVPYPKPDWMWDDFVQTAKQLTRDTNGDGRTDQHGLGTEASLQRLAPFIWQNGGELVDNPAAPTSLAFDRPKVASALQWFVDLQVEHRVVPNALEEQSEDSESRFQNGRLAMFLNSRRGVPTYREIEGFDWDVAPLPKGERAAGILHADAYFMAKAARDKDRVWQFIEFANSAAGQRIVATSGRTVPSLKQVAQSDAFLDPSKKPASSHVFLETLPILRAVPIHTAWVDVEETASAEIERAFHGHASVAEVVRSIQQRTLPLLAPHERP